MNAKRKHNPLTAEHLHLVDAATVQQTISESEIEYSVDIGRGIVIHHGFRFGGQIVIAELVDQKYDELAAIWYDDTQQ